MSSPSPVSSAGDSASSPPHPPAVTPGSASPLNNEIGVILGRKGTGKTTLARRLLSVLGSRRVLLCDTLGEYTGVGACPSGVADLVDYYNTVRMLPSWCIRFWPQDDREVLVWWSLCRLTYDTVIIADEVDRYCSAWEINPDLKWLLNYGRHRRVSLVGIARRPAAVHRDLTAQADWLAVFQTREPRDLAYLGQLMDTTALPSLPRFHWTTAGESTIFPITTISCVTDRP